MRSPTVSKLVLAASLALLTVSNSTQTCYRLQGSARGASAVAQSMSHRSESPINLAKTEGPVNGKQARGGVLEQILKPTNFEALDCSPKSA
jgi:hypothetical protein